jgi:hypothetical protein
MILEGLQNEPECLDYRHPFGTCECNWGFDRPNPNVDLKQWMSRRYVMLIRRVPKEET